MELPAVPLVVIATIWAAIFPVMKVVEMMNKRRDIVLDIDSKGERLRPRQKKILLFSDFIPMWVGVMLFLAIFASALLVLPSALVENNHKVTQADKRMCWCGAGFGFFALLVEIIGGGCEAVGMYRHITKQIHRQIRLRAYYKWDAAGRPAGDGLSFWLEAERESMDEG